jgi:hypothetical protein
LSDQQLVGPDLAHAALRIVQPGHQVEMAAQFRDRWVSVRGEKPERIGSAHRSPEVKDQALDLGRSIMIWLSSRSPGSGLSGA